MLRPVPMVRVELLALDRDLTPLSERIGELALLHPIDALELGPWAVPLDWSEMDDLSAEYGSTDRRLERVRGLLGLAPGEPGLQVPIAPVEVLRQVRELLDGVEPSVKELEDRAHQLQARRVGLEGIQAQLQLLSGLEVDLGELRRLRFLRLVAGLIPLENLPRLEESLREIPHLVVRIRRVGERELVFAFSQHDDAELLDRALQGAYLERMEIPSDLTGSPADALSQLEEGWRELEVEAREMERDRELLREEWAAELRRAREALNLNGRLVSLWRQTARTERTRLLVGWIPRARRDGFATEVEATAEGRAVLTVAEPEPDAEGPRLEVPTALVNPAPVRPFEQLTRTYGLPDYWDLDPTPLAALLYVVMFGAMFGDLGQGAVLALLGVALATGRIVKGQRDFGQILAACGVSAMVFGILYGSVFALEELLPAFWLRPMEDPLLLIGAAIAFGVLVLSVGLVFGVVSAWRRRDPADFFLGQNGLAGLWLYWGLVASVLLVAFGRGSFSLWMAGPLVGIPLLLLFLHAPIARALGWSEEEVDASYAIQSGVESFDLVVRFVSNTVSFLRVGAFALGHVGLGVAVLALAELLHGVPGGLVGILILGNLVILTLETLIVGIQALRLEYYEFFTKFLRGGGVAFRPFTLRPWGVESQRAEREA